MNSSSINNVRSRMIPAPKGSGRTQTARYTQARPRSGAVATRARAVDHGRVAGMGVGMFINDTALMMNERTPLLPCPDRSRMYRGSGSDRRCGVSMVVCRPRSRVVRLARGFLVPSLLLSTAAAQSPERKSEVSGQVILAATRAPVPGARVSLEGQDLAVTTDKEGKFKFPRIAAGLYVVRAEVEGFPAATSRLEVFHNDRLELEFLVGAQPGTERLPDIEVATDMPVLSPVPEFNRRLQEGGGRYFTRKDIERRQTPTLFELVRTVPGIRVSCARSSLQNCDLRLRSNSCHPEYYLDGGPADASIMYLVSPGDVEGIEIYGASEVPTELFMAEAGGCGIIAVWTRRGGPVKRPPRAP